MIRINNSCNLNCKFCIDKKQISAPCLCFQDDEKIELTCKEVDNIVEQIIKMDACQVKIIGGEPFWDKQKLFGIIDIINKAHLESVIYTNGLLISEEDAQKLSKYNTKIILNIFEDGEKEQEIYLNKVMEVIEHLKRNNVFFLVEYITAFSCSNTKKTIERLGISKEKIHIKYLFPKDSDIGNEESPIKLKLGNIGINIANYQTCEDYNLCFNKSIFINCDGNIYPCIGLIEKQHRLGDYRNGIYKIFKDEKYLEYWELSNMSDEMCKECAERLSCINCKAFSIIHNKKYRCADSV